MCSSHQSTTLSQQSEGTQNLGVLPEQNCYTVLTPDPFPSLPNTKEKVVWLRETSVTLH